MAEIKKIRKDFGCDNHIWIELVSSPDAQCLNCSLASWNSLTYDESQKITREEFKNNPEKYQ